MTGVRHDPMLPMAAEPFRSVEKNGLQHIFRPKMNFLSVISETEGAK
jgi:hypothetical protein